MYYTAIPYHFQVFSECYVLRADFRYESATILTLLPLVSPILTWYNTLFNASKGIIHD